MTLRQLSWMADARREQEFDVALATVGYLGAAMGGSLRAEDANPYREKVPKTAEQKREESREGFELLGRFLKGMAEDGGARG
jgi:hypothetical protein